MLFSLKQKLKDKHFIIKIILISILIAAYALPHFGEDVSHLDDTLIVWYVGQGQMVTYVNETHCHHFDMGGEFFPEKELFKICGSKKNQVTFSHWDYDHINFIKKAYRILPSLCRVSNNSYLPMNPKKSRLIQKLLICKKPNKTFFREIVLPRQAQPRSSNEKSRIFIVKDKVLIPGDSTAKMERHWSDLIRTPLQLLILGHHGSRSSTSDRLLNKLPFVHLAIASARKKRYSHPHSQVIERLRDRKILLIRTEDFRHIQVSLKDKKIKALPLY